MPKYNQAALRKEETRRFWGQTEMERAGRTCRARCVFLSDLSTSFSTGVMSSVICSFRSHTAGMTQVSVLEDVPENHAEMYAIRDSYAKPCRNMSYTVQNYVDKVPNYASKVPNNEYDVQCHENSDYQCHKKSEVHCYEKGDIQCRNNYESQCYENYEGQCHDNYEGQCHDNYEGQCHDNYEGQCHDNYEGQGHENFQGRCHENYRDENMYYTLDSSTEEMVIELTSDHHEETTQTSEKTACTSYEPLLSETAMAVKIKKETV